MTNTLCALGIMSGTSLDGIDLALCRFKLRNRKWSYEIISCKTIPYNRQWKYRLENLINSDALTFSKAGVDWGLYAGKLAKSFIEKSPVKPDLIASHGHTVFHQPSIGLTTQIGSGACLAALTNTAVVNDFRSADVAKGGQGAPLVPTGDRLLFGQYDYCLNLGGIANISFEAKQERIAFDICPVNMALNYLAGKEGKDYDRNGQMASRGTVNNVLLKKMNSLPYYNNREPKSLGAEWFNSRFKPLLDNSGLSVRDQQATVVRHVCEQIKKVLVRTGSNDTNTMLVTGGGTYHSFMMKQMKQQLPVNIIIPEKEIIEYKEALIFAFLGILRWRKETNTLASVTGAITDSCSGAVYLP